MPLARWDRNDRIDADAFTEVTVLPLRTLHP